MASLPLSRAVSDTLRYFDPFDYPLTAHELWLWQSVSPPQSQLSIRRERWPHVSAGFYHLPGRKKIVAARPRRTRYSRTKWLIAKRAGDSLKKIPTIQSIFVTGALSMDNSDRYDDIDLMIVTSPHTLWLTRFLTIFYLQLKSLRRPPQLSEHSSPRVSDKICDNLYLDTGNLVIHTPSLYHAHEILQAKCLFDRGGVHPQFLLQNPWVGNYLPVAYRESIKKFKNLKLNENFKFQISNLLYPINLLLFTLQYLYMKPKMTTEKVGLGFAFFHPRPTSPTQSRHPTDPDSTVNALGFATPS